MSAMSPLKTAIDLAGGAAAVGRQFGISGQAVSQWKRVPSTRAIALSQLTGGAVTAHQLRPDLYPVEIVVALPPGRPNTHAAAEAVQHPEDGYRDRCVPDVPPPCDEAAREPSA